MKTQLRDERGRFVKAPQFADYTKGVNRELSGEEILELTRDLERPTPVQLAYKAGADDARKDFNWHYKIWITSIFVGMAVMWYLGYTWPR